MNGELLLNVQDEPVVQKTISYNVKVFIGYDKIGNKWYRAELTDVGPYLKVNSYAETIPEAIEGLKRNFEG